MSSVVSATCNTRPRPDGFQPHARTGLPVHIPRHRCLPLPMNCVPAQCPCPRPHLCCPCAYRRSLCPFLVRRSEDSNLCRDGSALPVRTATNILIPSDGDGGTFEEQIKEMIMNTLRCTPR